MEDYAGPGGWVKVHRRILSWRWVTSPNHVAVFINLLLHANYKETEWRKEKLFPGQVLTGRKQLMEWTGLSEKQVRKCLDDLEESKEIVRRKTNQYSIITILKWDDYQGEGQPGAVQGQSEGTTEGSPRATSKKVNNTKKEKKDKNIIKSSPLSFLFPNDEKIQTWLLTGKTEIQERLLDDHSHHTLVEEIARAYVWQLARQKRKADLFLVNWMGNKKPSAFNPNQAHKSFSSNLNTNTSTLTEADLNEARELGII